MSVKTGPSLVSDTGLVFAFRKMWYYFQPSEPIMSASHQIFTWPWAIWTGARYNIFISANHFPLLYILRMHWKVLSSLKITTDHTAMIPHLQGPLYKPQCFV